MNEYVLRVTMPKGWKNVKRENAEKIIEKAVTTLNPDIKVQFAMFRNGIDWYSFEKKA